MRYESWDVIIFQETSKVPVREFKTQCFVTPDRDSPYLHNPGFLNPAAYYQTHGNLGQLPVLTTFIPSMATNTPFRVSVHCWDQPQPSRFMESLLQPDDVLLFEARVFVDGLCVAGSVFSQRSSWPQVLDLSSHVDKNGNQDLLRFPPFHQEILEQRHWDASDLHDVLECSSIAWPNASLWTREPRPFKYQSRTCLSDLRDPEDAHAHSPTRHNNNFQHPLTTNNQIINNPALQNPWKGNPYPGHIPQWQGPYREPRWAPPDTAFVDPFIDPYVLDPSARHRGARPSWEDISMPDYISSSTSSRAISNMTGISYEHSKHPSIVSPINEEPYSQFIEALSPPKPLSCSTQPQNSAPSTSILPMGAKLSAAAEARSVSYSKGGSRTSASVLKEISCPGTRDVSGSSAKSNAGPTDPTVERVVAAKLHPNLSGAVKGKKEGISLENKENEVETPRKDNDKAHQTHSKLTLHTSGNMETPTDARRKLSVSSRDECHTVHKGETVLLSPSQDLSCTGDHTLQANLDCFLDSQPTLVTATAGIEEIE
ncbi:hypothetical protein ARAM_004952 [Aspergillus rambellii]|uniref:Uncharacterized protein n=2 Tax=Aspergillus subgen. Nidulantes TaxID=2720870 RepID=A0A0F8WQB0_9EURO|nr:hypothetical protein AOCH_006599 [Aspergillus ochraceoroseus]KKK19835.1 hypothetical protein ARAM_004952 [Aspergillus rambellii]